MKKTLLMLSMTLMVALSSCTSDESICDEITLSPADSVETVQMRYANEKLKTRARDMYAGVMTDDEAVEILSPYTRRGENFQSQVLLMCQQAGTHEQIPQADIDMVSSLSSADLALVAVATDAWLGNIEPYNPTGSLRIADKILPCLIAVSGLAEIAQLTNQPLTLKVAIKLIRQVASKSSAGAISVAIMILEFLDCIYD